MSHPADLRGLTPRFWSHVRPSGDVNLDMDTRLDLTAATVPRPRAADSEPARSAVEGMNLFRYRPGAGGAAGVTSRPGRVPR
ncbi:hypothetical protein GCM10010269_73530 [Streptomyces humidus]|uniref:Uncharacterized protein n=1 Tax=Streptomyces humidus TaxID=52259 RepID=A0A918G922_9ACTN|nr:hypothetical protein GCM10010269_73530 [Streptomyces humidus]